MIYNGQTTIPVDTVETGYSFTFTERELKHIHIELGRLNTGSAESWEYHLFCAIADVVDHIKDKDNG